MQAVATGFRDSHFHNVTDFAGLFINYNRQQPGRAANLSGRARGPASRSADRLRRPTSETANSRCCSASSACRRCSRSSLSVSGTWPSMSAPGVPGRARIFERERLRVTRRSRTSSSVASKSAVRLAGKADDEIARHGDIGPGGADARRSAPDSRRRCGGGSSPSGCGRSPTAPADADKASAPAGRDARRSARRPCRADGWWCSAAAPGRGSRRAGTAAGRGPIRAPLRSLAMPGVDVLAEQRDLAHAGGGQPLGLGDDLRHRPRHFRAARIGHDAEGAELVAAFLDGEEGGDAAAPRPPRASGAGKCSNLSSIA